MSEVGPRSSEVKVPQVEQEVVRGVGDLQAAPSMDTEDVEIAFKSTTGMVTSEPTTQTNGRHWSTDGRHVCLCRPLISL